MTELRAPWPFDPPTDDMDPALASLHRQNHYIWRAFSSDLSAIRSDLHATREQVTRTNGRVGALEVVAARHGAQIDGLDRLDEIDRNSGRRVADALAAQDARRWRAVVAAGRAAVSKPVLVVVIPLIAGWLGWTDYLRPLIEPLLRGG